MSIAKYTRIETAQEIWYVETEKLLAYMANHGWRTGRSREIEEPDHELNDDGDLIDNDGKVYVSLYEGGVPSVDDIEDDTEVETLRWSPSQIENGMVGSSKLVDALRAYQMVDC